MYHTSDEKCKEHDLANIVYLYRENTYELSQVHCYTLGTCVPQAAAAAAVFVSQQHLCDQLIKKKSDNNNPHEASTIMRVCV